MIRSKELLNSKSSATISFSLHYIVVSSAKEDVESFRQKVDKLKDDEKNLKEKIERKRVELSALQKRLTTLQGIRLDTKKLVFGLLLFYRPAFMDEYEKLEEELQRLYVVYLEKFRNLDFLENQLDELNREELEKTEVVVGFSQYFSPDL